MGAVIAFLLNNKTLVIVAILVAIMAGEGIYIKIQKGHIANLEGQAQVLKDELAISQASVKTLRASIDTQNAAIDKMKSDADAREVANRKEVEKAKAAAVVYKRRADELMKVRPDPGVPVCESANKLINQEIQSAK